MCSCIDGSSTTAPVASGSGSTASLRQRTQEPSAHQFSCCFQLRLSWSKEFFRQSPGSRRDRMVSRPVQRRAFDGRHFDWLASTKGVSGALSSTTGAVHALVEESVELQVASTMRRFFLKGAASTGVTSGVAALGALASASAPPGPSPMRLGANRAAHRYWSGRVRHILGFSRFCGCFRFLPSKACPSSGG